MRIHIDIGAPRVEHSTRELTLTLTNTLHHARVRREKYFKSAFLWAETSGKESYDKAQARKFKSHYGCVDKTKVSLESSPHTYAKFNWNFEGVI